MNRKKFFKHFRTEKCGSITVCGELVRGQAFAVGVAFCSPDEKNFSRKIGRYIAEGRLRGFLKKPHADFGRGWVFITELDQERDLMDHIRRVLPEINGPQWFPAFLKEWRKFGREREKSKSKLVLNE